MKDDKDKDLVKVTHEPHIILCPMNATEKEFDQDQLLQCLQKQNDLDAEKKAVVADLTARAKKLTEVLEDLKKGLMSGKKMRSVECTLTLNYSTLTAELCNKETQELIQQRPMFPEERRMDPTPKLIPDEDEEPTDDPQEILPFDPDPTPAPDADADTSTPTGEEPTAAGDAETNTGPSEELTVAEANALADEKLGGLTDPMEELPEGPGPAPDAADPAADDDLSFWLGEGE